MRTNVRVSLIVLNFNGDAVLKPCVESLLTDMSNDDELIIVDNASTDSSRSYITRLEDPRIKTVMRLRNNFIFGLNDGLAVSQGEFVAFLNNDLTVDRGYITKCVARFDGPEVFAVCPRILQADGRDQGALTTGVWRRGLIFYDVHAHTDAARTTFFAVGGMSLFRRRELERIGSIDPLYFPMYHEDIELSLRAWKSGMQVRYAGDAIVRHIGGHSSSKRFSPAQLRSFVRQNEVLIIWKTITSRRLLFAHFLWTPPRLLAAVVHRDVGTLIGTARAYMRWRQALVARRRVKPFFVLTDREVLRRTASPPELTSGSPQHGVC